MLFNSLDFLIFIVLVFVGYWFVFNKTLKLQNFFVFVVSYIFYAWWDWRFLFLISFSALQGFFAGILIDQAREENIRKLWLIVSVTVNLIFLGFFKYFNFFAASFQDLLLLIGAKPDFVTLNIILPIGISFYTFHNISYLVDVYRKDIPVCKDVVVYLSFMSYFPQLVAGPIQRAKDLIPQFNVKREFSYPLAVAGLEQALWGFFKKIVIADNCAILVNTVFDNYEKMSGVELILGIVYFSFQIYGDFSGYTDIALGISKLFGITLTTNFKTPYFSQTIPEFWSRWHISLTTWFKDYVYIPLGGSRISKYITLRNTFIIFLISGLWHGANWTFVIWGLVNALFFIPYLYLNTKKSNDVTVVSVIKMLFVFGMIGIAWVFFRATNIQEALGYITGLVRHPFWPSNYTLFSPFKVMPLIILFIMAEWIIYLYDKNKRALQVKPVTRLLVYTIVLTVVLFNMKFHNPQEFIYFQF